MKKNMRLFPLLATVLILASCNKDKAEVIKPKLNYVKHWAANTNFGELKDYGLNFDILADGSGTFNYGKNNMPYTGTPLTWNSIQKDSIQVNFVCNDFPNYRFEFRGLANEGLTFVDGYYIRINKLNENDRVYRGEFTFD